MRLGETAAELDRMCLYSYYSVVYVTVCWVGWSGWWRRHCEDSTVWAHSGWLLCHQDFSCGEQLWLEPPMLNGWLPLGLLLCLPHASCKPPAMTDWMLQAPHALIAICFQSDCNHPSDHLILHHTTWKQVYNVMVKIFYSHMGAIWWGTGGHVPSTFLPPGAKYVLSFSPFWP